MTQPQNPNGPSRRPVVIALDDSALNRAVLEALLAPADVDLLFAVDGQTGVELISQNEPDLILMDLFMPGMDGIETLAHIRSDERAQNRNRCPAILLTADHQYSSEAKNALEFFDDHVHKPIDADRLLDTVERHLNRPGRCTEVAARATKSYSTAIAATV